MRQKKQIEDRITQLTLANLLYGESESLPVLINKIRIAELQRWLIPPQLKRGPKPKPPKPRRRRGRPQKWDPEMFEKIASIKARLEDSGKSHSNYNAIVAMVEELQLLGDGNRLEQLPFARKQKVKKFLRNLEKRYSEYTRKK